MRRLLTGLLGVTLLLSACGDDDGDDDDRSAVTSIPEQTTTSSTTTTKPAVPPPDVIPEDVSLITEEYVEQVANLLFMATNEALLLTKQAGLVDDQVVALVRATATQRREAAVVNDLVQAAANGFPGLIAEPTGLKASVKRVVIASRTCVFAEVDLDRSGVSVEEPPAGLRDFLRLRAREANPDPQDLNPTAWLLDGLPGTTDGSEPDPECEKSP